MFEQEHEMWKFSLLHPGDASPYPLMEGFSMCPPVFDETEDEDKRFRMASYILLHENGRLRSIAACEHVGMVDITTRCIHPTCVDIEQVLKIPIAMWCGLFFPPPMRFAVIRSNTGDGKVEHLLHAIPQPPSSANFPSQPKFENVQSLFPSRMNERTAGLLFLRMALLFGQSSLEPAVMTLLAYLLANNYVLLYRGFPISDIGFKHGRIEYDHDIIDITLPEDASSEVRKVAAGMTGNPMAGVSKKTTFRSPPRGQVDTALQVWWRLGSKTANEYSAAATPCGWGFLKSPLFWIGDIDIGDFGYPTFLVDAGIDMHPDTQNFSINEWQKFRKTFVDVSTKRPLANQILMDSFGMSGSKAIVQYSIATVINKAVGNKKSGNTIVMEKTSRESDDWVKRIVMGDVNTQ